MEIKNTSVHAKPFGVFDAPKIDNFTTTGNGHTVNSKLSIEDQIAAIRKQVAVISKELKVPLDADFKILEDLVVVEKKRRP